MNEPDETLRTSFGLEYNSEIRLILDLLDEYF